MLLGLMSPAGAMLESWTCLQQDLDCQPAGWHGVEIKVAGLDQHVLPRHDGAGGDLGKDERLVGDHGEDWETKTKVQGLGGIRDGCVKTLSTFPSSFKDLSLGP